MASISRKSWHYRLAVFGLLDAEYEQIDLCRYFWALVRGVGRVPFFVVLGAALGYTAVLGPLLALWVWLATGFFVPDSTAAIGFAIWLIATVMGSAFYLTGRDFSASPTVQIAGAAYRGWKEKTCVLIDVQ